jgi:tetratricopeptide (TPR) repeat protein
VLEEANYVFFYQEGKSVRDKDPGQCLTEDTLTEYLDGSLDPAIKAASEVHLISCDGCRDRLGFFMKILNENVSAEEASQLQVITQQWDSAKHRMPRRTGTLQEWFFRVVAIAAVLVLAIIAVRVLTEQRQPKSANEIVQLLLEQQRPFESRLANEPHLPIVRTRGLEDPGIAYGLIASEMTRLSADSHQMGRFYLLQKDFSRAVPYLEIAAREVGAGPEVHNDLGVAYLEGNGTRIEKAAEEFRHALDLDPGFAPAVFNLGLFYERISSPEQAEVQWQRYFQLDPNSDWGKEARSRLQGLSR